jgi:hypothetical protein
MAKATKHDRIKAALEAIRRSHRGRLTARAVVEAAKNPRHPLHSEFEWNNQKAADQQRLERARELIRYITIVSVDATRRIETRYYAHDPKTPHREGYVSILEMNRRDAEQDVVNAIAICESTIDRALHKAEFLSARHRGVSRLLRNAVATLAAARDILDSKRGADAA